MRWSCARVVPVIGDAGVCEPSRYADVVAQKFPENFPEICLCVLEIVQKQFLENG